jgi:SAM-dependent methyltransferase
VLDVGCGTGAVAAALAEQAQAKVWAVEPSDEMRAVAERRLPRGVGLRSGRAEALPFREGWFDGVVYSLVVHLLDRKSSFAEARRVLAADGRIVIATFAAEHFDTYWAAPYFPSIGAIDRARFPTQSALTEELDAAGFASPVVERITSRHTISRELALERIRGRHISTFDLLEERELATGTARAERELPDAVDVRLEQLVVAARRS